MGLRGCASVQRSIPCVSKVNMSLSVLSNTSVFLAALHYCGVCWRGQGPREPVSYQRQLWPLMSLADVQLMSGRAGIGVCCGCACSLSPRWVLLPTAKLLRGTWVDLNRSWLCPLLGHLLNLCMPAIAGMPRSDLLHGLWKRDTENGLENPPCFPALCSGWGCGVAVEATISDGVVSVSAES